MKSKQEKHGQKSISGSNYKPYTDYKDSNVEWLGKIPSHWQVVNNFGLFQERKQTNSPELPFLNVSIHDGVTVKKETEENLKKMSEDKSRYKIAKAGDIVGNRMRMWQGAIGRAPIDGLVSPAYIVANPFEHAHSKYYGYLFRTNIYQVEAWKNSKGLVPDRFNLYWDDYKSMKSLYPPFEEQKTIVKFLDRETSKIDRLIEKKEKLIGLLEEKRTALISKTITHGISQDNEMEDSGVTWLRKKPKNWDVLRLRHCCEINPSKSEITSDLLDQKATFLPMENIGFGEILDSSETGIVGELKDGFTYFREGDVLVAKITPCFENGKGALTKDLKNRIGFGTTELHVLRTNEKIINKFLLYLTNSGFFREVGERMMRGSAGQKRVPSKFIKNFPVFLPPLDKQEYIVKYLEDELSDIERVVQKNLESIEKLKEYRTALISAAVIGKIDVRGEVE